MQGLQAATQHTEFTFLYVYTNVWITTCKSILFYLNGRLRMTYRRTHLDPRERKYKEKGQNNTRTNSIMIYVVHSFWVTKPRRMIQMGGARSTRGADEKCTDHEGKRPTKTSLKEHRAWSSQVRESGSRRDREGLYKRKADWLSHSLLQKDCAMQYWSFSYIRIKMLAEEKPLWLIHQYRILISLSRDVPVWPSSCCECLHCCTELPAAVCYQCARKLNCQQKFVTSVQANWTVSSNLLPLCKQTEQNELPAAVCYHCASKLNCQQQFVTSVQANWTVSSSLLPACKQTELSAAVFYHCANKAVPFTINNNCCQYHNAKLKPYMQYIGTV